MIKLLLLFILIPAVELALLIELGSRIGTMATLGLIVATGVLGAYLARRQGLSVFRQVRAELAAGRIPAEIEGYTVAVEETGEIKALEP